ncbi:hypothetical protein PSI23_04165 [Xenorhabdus sp. XENO-10]|uniref:Uncharacterized protein n=1 Tax=Xenorhabdus yunnanensis TaxID=3025878 RepID=A0ABT5LBU4_9GAMM|nr:hypothetical protein [Xenorhabdus yunnanensis]MDC9588529.1 hypothetical protein [Xenorhabdus yunnanensis]
MKITNKNLHYLDFSSVLLPCFILKKECLFKEKRKILVINFKDKTICLEENGILLSPFCSIITYNTKLSSSDDVLCFFLPDNIFKVNNVNWKNSKIYDGLIKDYSDNDKFIEKKFLRSNSDSLGIAKFNPNNLWNNYVDDIVSQQFEVKVNLWFAEQGTHCGIHNEHSFIEIHTQILGFGRMQCFKNEKYNSLYKEIAIAPGTTTSRAFCNGGHGYKYPYHQYYADTNSIWLALEYHPLTSY